MSYTNSRELKDIRIQLLITESNKQKLKAKAKELNVSMNEVMNRLIREFIEKI